jgi:CubicO group peptidase (beta-lactamase class C family)
MSLRNSSIRRLKRFTGVSLAAALSCTAFAAQSSGTSDRIARVQNLVPPVLVTGETPKLKPLATRMEELKVPAVSVAVIHEGRIEWAHGFGVIRADGPPVTANTLFQAASISKPVFALAVLHQVDAGTLDLDKNVNDYLKGWKLPDNDFTQQKPVTLREMLTHSAGLTVHGFPGYAADGKLPAVAQILDGTPPANTAAIRVDILPGSRWRYSGGGYVLAQQVLSDVTGIPLPKLLRETVLAPLGMSRSTYEQPLPAARLVEVAMPHGGDGQPLREGPHVYPEMAAAGLWTTPTDLAHYALGVQSTLAGKSKMMSAKTARAMLTPVIGQQGLGPQLGGATSRKYFSHGGSNAGYRCLFVAYEDGEGAVIMTSSDRGDELIGEVMRTIAYVYQWPDFAPPTRTAARVAPDVLKRFTGVYDLHDGSSYVVRLEGDRLIGHVLGNTPAAMLPASERQLFGREVDVVVDFTIDPDGTATSVHHKIGGWERNGQRADASRAQVILEFVDQTALRIKEQRVAPGSEAAIRKTLAGLAAGKPDYDILNPMMANVLRQNLEGLQSFIAGQGALKALTFKKVTDAGNDEFDIDFEKGAMRISVGMNEAGKVAAMYLTPR